MRTYAPTETTAVLEALLGEPSLARGVVHHAIMPARAAEYGDFPSWLDPRIVAGLASDVTSKQHPATAARICSVMMLLDNS